MERLGEDMEEGEGDVTITPVDLGYSSQHLQGMEGGAIDGMGNMAGLAEADKGEGSSKTRVSPKRKADEMDDEDEGQEGDTTDLDAEVYRARLEQMDGSREGDGWSQRDELAGIVSSHPFAYAL